MMAPSLSGAKEFYIRFAKLCFDIQFTTLRTQGAISKTCATSLRNFFSLFELPVVELEAHRGQMTKALNEANCHLTSYCRNKSNRQYSCCEIEIDSLEHVIEVHQEKTLYISANMSPKILAELANNFGELLLLQVRNTHQKVIDDIKSWNLGEAEQAVEVYELIINGFIQHQPSDKVWLLCLNVTKTRITELISKIPQEFFPQPQERRQHAYQTIC